MNYTHSHKQRQYSAGGEVLRYVTSRKYPQGASKHRKQTIKRLSELYSCQSESNAISNDTHAFCYLYLLDVRARPLGLIQVKWDIARAYNIMDSLHIKIQFRTSINGDVIVEKECTFAQRSLLVNVPSCCTTYNVSARAAPQQVCLDGTQYTLSFPTASVAHINTWYNRKQMSELQMKAELFLEDARKQEVVDLYRNKSGEVFNEIRGHCNNIMAPYVRKNSGNKKAPINGNICSLFFSTKTFHGEMPYNSPFGDTRLVIAAERIVTEDKNYYFGDFYCSQRGNHFITVVVATPGSPEDDFCCEHLPQLDIRDNPFLWISGGGCGGDGGGGSVVNDDGNSATAGGSTKIYVADKREMYPEYHCYRQLYTHVFYCDDVNLTKEVKLGAKIKKDIEHCERDKTKEFKDFKCRTCCIEESGDPAGAPTPKAVMMTMNTA